MQAEAKRRAVSPSDQAGPVNGTADSQDDDDDEDEDDSEGERPGLAAQHKERALQTLDARPAAIKPSTQACTAHPACMLAVPASWTFTTATSVKYVADILQLGVGQLVGVEDWRLSCMTVSDNTERSCQRVDEPD